MKKFFNMIEVTLAIAVVGLGMAGIMSLFPVGVQASRDAIGDNYSADSVEQMLAYMAAACQSSWTTYISSDGTTGNIKEYAAVSPIADTDTTPPVLADRIGDTNLFNTAIGSGKDVFCIRQPATGNPDFAAHIRIWKAKITNMTIAGNSGVELPYYDAVHNLGAVRLYAEISWPVEKPYSKRTKRVYTIELFKQN